MAAILQPGLLQHDYQTARDLLFWRCSIAVDRGTGYPRALTQVDGFVRLVLHQHGLHSRCDAARMVSAQLVSNALSYGGTPVLVAVSRLGGDLLCVDVTDTEAPCVQRASISREDVAAGESLPSGGGVRKGGTSLQTLGRHASSWGIGVRGRGTTIWAVLNSVKV
jgi:hypothetical protein